MFTKTLLAAAVIAAYRVHGHAAEQGEPATVLAQSAAGQQSIAQSQGKSYAQELVLRSAAKHPELLELDPHTTPPGESASVIVASKNPSQIGHPTDADDREMMKTGIPFVEINKIGNQNVEVHVQLLDVSRKTVGVVDMTFRIRPAPASTRTNSPRRQRESVTR